MPVTVTVVAGAPPGGDPLPTCGEPLVGLSVMVGSTKNTGGALDTVAKSAGVTVEMTVTLYSTPVEPPPGAVEETMKEPVTVPPAPIVQPEEANKPGGDEVHVQGPASAPGKSTGVAITVIVAPALPWVMLKVMLATTALTCGGLPREGSVVDGMVTFGIVMGVNGRILISGMMISGMVMCGAGTMNADMNRSTRYTKLTRRVFKPRYSPSILTH